jgi:phosphoglycerate dehydrogenase-like enzyme
MGITGCTRSWPHACVVALLKHPNFLINTARGARKYNTASRSFTICIIVLI